MITKKAMKKTTGSAQTKAVGGGLVFGVFRNQSEVEGKAGWIQPETFLSNFRESRWRLTPSLMTVTVASATFMVTGTQSSLLEESVRFSIAPFRVSIPAIVQEERQQDH